MRAIASLAVLVAVPAASASTIQVIYSNISGDPTAQVPGVKGEEFRSPLAPFLTLYGSPDGSHWIFKAFTNNPDSALNDVVVAGSGTVGATVAKEGDPAPLDGLTYGFLDSDCGINDSGLYAFGNRLAGGLTSNDEVIIAFDGKDLFAAAREGDAAPNLIDPEGAGNELFGNSLNSAHVLSNGTVAYRADLIENIATDFESALYHGAAVAAQEGTMATGGETMDGFVALSGNTFSSSADGSSWIAEADILPGVGTTEAVVVGGTVVLADGDLLDGFGSPVDSIFQVDMAGTGDWFCTGELADGTRFALRNGAVIAATGMPITPGDLETFTDSMIAVTGNSTGDYVVVASTSNADPAANQVVVLNGETVVARSGMTISALPGSPLIGGFDAADAILTDGPTAVYLFIGLADDAGAAVGDAFVVVDIVPPCPWDLDGCGVVSTSDLLSLLSEWGTFPGGPPDFDGDGVGTSDLLKLLANWGPCPG